MAVSCVNVIMAGTGSAFHPLRGGSSVLIDFGHGMVFVDVGCRAPYVAASLGVDPWEVDLYLFTHSHYDHLCGFPMILFLKSFMNSGRDVVVYAPRASAEDLKRVVEVGGRGRVRMRFRGLREGGKDEVVLGPSAKIALNSIKAVHSIEALSYSLEFSGIKILVSGDTYPTSEFKAHSRGASLAIHEATMTSDKEEDARLAGHSTVSGAIKQVEEAELGLLYHLTEESEREAVRALSGSPGKNIVLPKDGSLIRLC